MKKLILILALIAASFMTAHGADYFWYEPDGRVDFDVSETAVTVQVDPAQFTTWQNITESDQALDETADPEPIASHFHVLTVNEGYDIDSLLNRLRDRDDILYANAAFIDETEQEIYLTRSLVVIFRAETSRTAIYNIIDMYNLVLVDTLFGDFRFQALEVTEDSPADVLTIGNDIYELGVAKLARASFILPFERFSDPNDEYWEYQWHFKNTGQTGGTPDADIDLDLARDYYMPTTPILVAVVDDGFAPHADLPAGRLADGWNYVSDEDDESPWETDAHGMATAGIICANTNNGTGLASITGFNVRVLNQKIFHHWAVASESDIGRALSNAIDSGAVAISNSWGRAAQTPSTAIDSALNRAHDLGVVTVFASGNAGYSTIGYPACHAHTISVGATDSTDQRWYYSQYGPLLDVVAPGANVNWNGHFWSLDQMGVLGKNDGSMDCLTQDADYLCNFGGTSAACPQVSGICILLMLRRPDLIGDPDRVRRIIRLSADREQYGGTDTLRVNNYVGWGRVNADRALLAVTRGDADNNGLMDVDDVTYIINYVFGGGPEPQPRLLNGDANCSGSVDIDDVVFLINYIFGGGPEPPDCFIY